MEWIMITRLRWWWSFWYRNETVAILGIWLTKGATAFYQKGGVWGSNPRCLPDCQSTSIVRVTLIFSHVQCVRRQGYAHTLYCIDKSGDKKDRVYYKILSQTIIGDENTLIRKGALNDGFFEKISTAYISSFKKSESLRLTWASVNQYPSVLR